MQKEKFVFVQSTAYARPVTGKGHGGYFHLALRRFLQNRSSVAAAWILLALLIFALLGPVLSPYTPQQRDGYYRWLPPVFSPGQEMTVTQAGYDFYAGIGYEAGFSPVESAVKNPDGTYTIRVDAYKKVGFVYLDLEKAELQRLQDYERATGYQVLYPLPVHFNRDFLGISAPANLWYQMRAGSTQTMTHTAEGSPIYTPAYLLDGAGQPVFAVENQTGYRCRVLYEAYYSFLHGHAPIHLFGTDQHGRDILACLGSGARLSFLLAFSVSVINFFIGVFYGAIEGYYGGKADLFMERLADVLVNVPFIVVATLFQLHLAQAAGPVGALLFSFVLTGWIGIAGRVRTQFYRFKTGEYVLAARTLGAGDRRIIFRHIFPNAIGTIITGTVLMIPAVIFSESMLSYLGIVDLESAGVTSVGTMLSGARQYLSSYPHMLIFPAALIALLEISFNLFGNGLRDAFNPALTEN